MIVVVLYALHAVALSSSRHVPGYVDVNIVLAQGVPTPNWLHLFNANTLGSYISNVVVNSAIKHFLCYTIVTD